MWYLHRKGGGRQSPERHRAIKTAPSATRRQPNVYRSATRARTLYAGRAAPPRPSWTPSRPGVRLSPSRPPLERRRASRGALCARTGVDARPENPCVDETIKLSFAFPEKSVNIGGHEDEPIGTSGREIGQTVRRDKYRHPLRRRAIRSADNRPARRFGAAHRTRERAPRAPPDPRLRASILAASRDTPRETRCASP